MMMMGENLCIPSCTQHGIPSEFRDGISEQTKVINRGYSWVKRSQFLFIQARSNCDVIHDFF